MLHCRNGDQGSLDPLGGDKIVIDREFARLAPPLAADELAGLERSLLAEGCRDPLVVWREILLDGHNRFRICTEHGIPFRTVALDLPDRQAALDWVIGNQLARRNLTSEGVSYLRGKQYLAAKKSHGGHHNIGPKGQNGPLILADRLAHGHQLPVPHRSRQRRQFVFHRKDRE